MYDQLTAKSCLTNMSDAFSEMFPTNTVVVGPLLSSVSLARMLPDSFFGAIGFCATVTVVGTRTCNSKNYILHFKYPLSRAFNKNNKGKHFKQPIITVELNPNMCKDCVSSCRSCSWCFNWQAVGTTVSNSLWGWGSLHPCEPGSWEYLKWETKQNTQNPLLLYTPTVLTTTQNNIT